MEITSCSLWVVSYLNEKGLLNHGTVVSTVMSNLGFYNAVEVTGLQRVQTKVGDRYVLEEMLANSYNFGGEQSGHLSSYVSTRSIFGTKMLRIL